MKIDHLDLSKMAKSGHTETDEIAKPKRKIEMKLLIRKIGSMSVTTIRIKIVYSYWLVR